MIALCSQINRPSESPHTEYCYYQRISGPSSLDVLLAVIVSTRAAINSKHLQLSVVQKKKKEQNKTNPLLP